MYNRKVFMSSLQLRFKCVFIVATVNLQVTHHQSTFFLKKRGLTVD